MAERPSSTVSVIRRVPETFREVIDQFVVVRNHQDQCESKIIDASTIATIDQCAVNFRHVSSGVSFLTETMSTMWCAPCLRFFQELQQGRLRGDVGKIYLYCAQAAEISEAFRLIAKRVREIAGSFHHAEQLVKNKARTCLDAVRQEEATARNRQARKDRVHDEAAEEASKKVDVAGNWGVAWVLTSAIPFVNIFTSNRFANAYSKAAHAKIEEAEALGEYFSATLELLEARLRHMEAEELHEAVSVLTQKMKDVETQCEGIAAFMAEKADSFGSKYAQQGASIDLLELGLENTVADKEIEWLSKTISDLEECHRLMEGITASSAYPSSARPQRLQIELPKLGITLQ